MPIVLSVISKVKDTGKTTLIEGLMKVLKQRGYRVMTLKYSCSDFDIDYEHTDSYRHCQAGADRTVVVGPKKMVVIENTQQRKSFDELISQYYDVDIILTEGFREVDAPTIEVIRREKGTQIYTDNINLIAIATDINELKATVPVYGLNDYRSMCSLIERRMLNKAM